ncbi:NRDE family protein [Flavobacterium luteum]|uniref:NRDE family protein n=1 Tax=Flavobacterium luteum TaxID=2026654 RepID=A0A7J5AD38_9FLAO|nr:NRDE family protein [Flavobacterium luteum]KAB1155506.1 hypothetical protein F6464_10340 [Flavobacterium luteum]
MCTVSFVNSQGKIIITSNRDEQVLRPATAPKNYLVNQKNIFFPKDPKAGGTWYAVDEQANVLVLLNGADEKHHWSPPYRKSRGLILLDIFSSESAIAAWESIDLLNIEPFTLVLFQDQQLYQLRWNGSIKESIPLDKNKNHIWSSATLYTKEIRTERAEWFYQFLDTKPEVNEEEMILFHKYSNNENKENGLVINRNDKLKTLSITQTVIEQNKVNVLHYDLINEDEFTNSFLIL